MKKSILLLSLVITSATHQTFGQLLCIFGDNSLFNPSVMEVLVDESYDNLLPSTFTSGQEPAKASFVTNSFFASEEKSLNANASANAFKPYTAVHSGAKIKSSINTAPVAKTNESKELITSYSIFPNPAYADANIRFHLRQPSTVKMSVYNLLGEKMKFEGIDGSNKYPAGESLVTLNTAELSSGVYLVELIADNTRLIKRLSVVK